MFEHMDTAGHDVPVAELDAQLKSISRRLSGGEDELQSFIIPEGKLFSNTFKGYALVNMAVTVHRNNESFRMRAQKELLDIISKLQAMSLKHPFNLNEKLDPKNGIIMAGHTNLLRAGYILIGGADPRLIRDFHDSSARIYASFLSGPTPFPECYPGLAWAQDAVFALESLRLHDVLYKTDNSAAYKRWSSWLKEHPDSECGMMVSQVNVKTGSIDDGARGCAIAWALGFLPNIDRDYASHQYRLFREKWFVPFGGMLGVHEWYQGREKPTTFFSGPVVFGLGAAASGIAIGACRANSDRVSWHMLLRSLETFGLPMWHPSGEKSYFAGQCLLADSLALWGKSVCKWDDPESAAARSQNEAGTPNWVQAESFSITFAMACLLAGLASGAIARRQYKAVLDPGAVRPAWCRVTVTACAVQCVSLLLCLCLPQFTWIQALILMAVTDMLEEMTLRPRIVAEIFYGPVAPGDEFRAC